MNKFEMDMTQGNLLKKMVQFTIPVMLTAILQLLYNAADLIVVSNFSSEANALGAVGSTNSTINVIISLCIGFSVGTNVLSARAYSTKDESLMKKVINQSLILGFGCGIILTAIGLIFGDKILDLMNNPIPLSRVYLKIFFLGVPFNLTYTLLAAVLRGTGDTKHPLIFLSIAGIINVLLNLFFCIVLHIGVRGVAIATITSQFLSFVMAIIYLSKTEGIVNFKLKNLKFDKDTAFQIVKIGVPAGLESSLFSISNLIIQGSVNEFGALAIDGHSAAGSIQGFVYMSMNACYHATISFTQQNVAIKKHSNLKRVLFFGCLIVTVIGLVLGNLAYIFRDPLISIYTKDPISKQVAFTSLLWMCAPYFVYGLTDVLCGHIRGMNSNLTPMLESLICICAFRIIYIYTVFKPLRDVTNPQDLWMLYASYLMSWILLIIVYTVTIVILNKKLKKEWSK